MEIDFLIAAVHALHYALIKRRKIALCVHLVQLSDGPTASSTQNEFQAAQRDVKRARNYSRLWL